jgi:phosphotransferase system enzyme I (PtsI)
MFTRFPGKKEECFMAIKITGVSASPGIAIARAYCLVGEVEIPERKTAGQPDEETARFRRAVEASRMELEALRSRTEERLGALKAEIFEAQQMVLDDPEFIGGIEDKIAGDRINAEYALYEVSRMFIEMLENMDNELLRERAADVRDIAARIHRHLSGKAASDGRAFGEPAVLVAADLAPSDTAQLDLQTVLGFVTEVGSRTSHTAIMARSLEIPAVVGAGPALRSIASGTLVILDGTRGELIVDPDSEQLAAYRQRKAREDRQKEEWRKLVHEPTVTRDGHRVELSANIGSVEDLAKVLENGAEGIGLFRTEFLFMGRSGMPSEEEQYRIYSHVLERMDGRPVIIRTLDIGGDKKLPYLPQDEEQNPFLGHRAIRLCLDRRDLFRTQLRALLRAGASGNLKIMFPMIAVPEELREAKRILREEKEKLDREGIPAGLAEVGMMMEIPAACVSADLFAADVDFFSIGTNDLIQYTMAADRMNEKVSYLYQPFHPSVLRLVRMVTEAAEKQGIWVGMCGEMAGDPDAIPLLLGLGLREFSMSAVSILPARSLIRRLSRAEWSARAGQLLSMRSQEQIREAVREILNAGEENAAPETG